MKLIRKTGATSEIWQIFIRDSSSTTGAGLTALTNASSGLTAYYHRDTDTSATAISLVTMTVGTFTSSGFKEIDSTNMPGWYQFCPPNAALASGAKSCAFHLKGATNMAPLPIECQLTAFDLDTATVVSSSVSALANNVITAASIAASALNGKGDWLVSSSYPTNFSALGISAGGHISNVDTLTTYTNNTPQTGDSFARLGAPAGASVSADVAAIKSDTGTILTDVNTGAGAIYTRIGAPAGASIAADIAAVNAKTTNLPASPAAVGDIPTANQNADALLDRTDAIETGLTPRQAHRVLVASAAGKLSGAATSTIKIRDLADTKDRITATVDADGNRTAITTILT